MNVKTKNRISILDGFRTIAILSVILYHYFFRWNDPIFPYFGGDYFHYGFKGVPFFFMISGFVICYTLEGTENSITFWKKRFIRLFPSILIASVLTYFFLLLFDNYVLFKDNHFRNLLISITFLPPSFYNLFSNIPEYFSYINSDYWSLWPEVQFYFLASSLYYIDKINFKRNFIVVCFTLLIIYNIFLVCNLDQIKFFEKVINLFNLIKFLPFFLSGALFFMLYKNKQNFFNVLLLGFVFLLINNTLLLTEFLASSIMFSLFFCFIYCPKLLHFLENKIFVKIGFSSYFLYLIHEYIGAVWIRNIVVYFYPYSFIAPILMIIFMVILSVLYTQKIESRISKYLHQHLLKKNNA